MKKLLLIIVVIILSCCKTIPSNYNSVFSYIQLDSIMKVEQFNWNSVDSTKFMDYSTKKIIVEYYYIKDNKMIRLIKLDNDSINVAKRIY